jgi:ribonuclease D
MTLITDTQTLADFCRRIESAEYLTIDTEFMREKTYWPILCLVQVGGPEEAAAIDAQADGMDLSPLFDLLADTRIRKVFHAARQDLEIMFHLMHSMPQSVFDTQVAAMVCGFGDSVGYETLVSKLARKSIDKSSRFTDWSLRPLSARQIEYALSDVTHLRVIYEKLKEKLAENGREPWLEEEMAVLTAPATYEPDPRTTFRRIKSRNTNRRYLAVLREVAAWRETEAQKRNLPRNHMLRDEALSEIAHHRPATVNDLARTRGLGRRLAEGPAGQTLLAAVQAGMAVPEDECPKPRIKQDLPRGIGPVVELLKVLLKLKCEETDVAQKLIASSNDLDAIAAFGEEADVRALSGWRRKVFGEDALRLRAGEIGLAVQGRKIQRIFLPADAD